MSLFENPAKWLRHGMRTLIAVGLVLSVAACGWQPLLAPAGSGGANVNVALSQIDIPPTKSRLGQLLRNNMISNLGTAGGSAVPLYRLIMVPTITKNDVLVQKNTDVRRIQYQLGVTYKLIDIATRQPINEGHSFSIVAYTRLQSEFANIRAEKDAKEKTAYAVAEDIKTRLAAFFSAR